jgi:large subunit ribosomal protein L15
MATKSKKEKSDAKAEISIGLGDLRPAKGATKTRLRVGRGRASGAGKTSNRGHNGEGQRSGRPTKRGFEGGQMPGYRRQPKYKGFFLVNPKKWLELNVCDLDEVLLPDETELTYDKLRERGLLRNGMEGLRLLGKGDCSRKVTIHAHYATPGAKEKLEGAGGSVVIVEASVPAKK